MPEQTFQFVHLRTFEASAADVPIEDDALRSLQLTLAENPEAGQTIVGTGGVRKIRLGVKGKGKSGGARVLYYVVVRRQVIYLLLAYDKSEADSISDRGKRQLRALVKQLEEEDTP